MNISAIFREMGGDGKAIYNKIREISRQKQVDRAIKQYDPKKHDVHNKSKRPDKIVFVPNGQKDPITHQDILVEDIEKVSRVSVPFQQYIIGQKADFAAGNGVTLTPSIEGTELFDRVTSNWYDNKTDYVLNDIFRQVMAYTQAAVIFYGDRDAETLDEFRFKFKVVSPEKGDKLEPFFDEDTGDFVGFGREYEIDGKNRYDLYYMGESGFAEIRRWENSTPILIGGGSDTDEPSEVFVTTYVSLPVVYWEQPYPECDITDDMITEYETALSDYCTQMGYSGDAILFGKGSVINMPAKGSAGKFIEGSADADLKFIQADNQFDAREFQLSLLKNHIFGLNKSVYLDIETMKALGDVSGRALKYYLTSVYMEATSKQKGYLGMGVQRMVNWLIDAWRTLLPESEDSRKLRIYVDFRQYELEDEEARIDLAMKANGGLPIMTHLSSITYAGFEEDSEQALLEINNQSRNGGNTN